MYQLKFKVKTVIRPHTPFLQKIVFLKLSTKRLYSVPKLVLLWHNGKNHLQHCRKLNYIWQKCNGRTVCMTLLIKSTD